MSTLFVKKWHDKQLWSIHPISICNYCCRILIGLLWNRSKKMVHVPSQTYQTGDTSRAPGLHWCSFRFRITPSVMKQFKTEGVALSTIIYKHVTVAADKQVISPAWGHNTQSKDVVVCRLHAWRNDWHIYTSMPHFYYINSSGLLINLAGLTNISTDNSALTIHASSLKLMLLSRRSDCSQKETMGSGSI
jgi:hypothetical protein